MKEFTEKAACKSAGGACHDLDATDSNAPSPDGPESRFIKPDLRQQESKGDVIQRVIKKFRCLEVGFKVGPY